MNYEIRLFTRKMAKKSEKRANQKVTKQKNQGKKHFQIRSFR